MMAFLMGQKTISPAALHARLREATARAFDLNSRQSYLSARVPGATLLEPGAWPESALPEDKAATLVFYCSNPFCRKAPLAARRAVKLGYRDVLVLSAGIQGWLDAGLPVESSEPPAGAA
jgi:rhodanese-related sulfurtransferase